MTAARLIDRLATRAWLSTGSLLRPIRRQLWVDAVIVLGPALFGLIEFAREWTGVPRPAIEIAPCRWRCPSTRKAEGLRWRFRSWGNPRC